MNLKTLLELVLYSMEFLHVAYRFSLLCSQMLHLSVLKLILLE